MTDDLLTHFISDEAVNILRPALKEFNKGLSSEARKALEKITPEEMSKDNKDIIPFPTLPTDKANILSAKVKNIRTKLSLAMAAEEEKHFVTPKDGEDRWQNAEIIRLKEEFDDKILVCIDGREVIECNAYMGNIESRKNNIVSKIGTQHLSDYKVGLSKLFSETGCEEPYSPIITELTRLMNMEAKKRPFKKKLGEYLLQATSYIHNPKP
jgi:hypothetical protein